LRAAAAAAAAEEIAEPEHFAEVAKQVLESAERRRVEPDPPPAAELNAGVAEAVVQARFSSSARIACGLRGFP
jgi:hypothetical protein